MGLFKDFKTFISRGNVVDLAVGVIIGAAFGKIVSSLVADIVMPPLGLVLGKVNFTDLKLIIGQGAAGKPPVTINYGNFLQATFDFLIVAFAIFLLIQAVNKLRRKEAAAPEPDAVPTAQEKLLMEIRDLLRHGAENNRL